MTEHDPFEEHIETMRRARRDFKEAKRYDPLADAINCAEEFFDAYDELVEILDPDGSWKTKP